MSAHSAPIDPANRRRLTQAELDAICARHDRLWQAKPGGEFDFTADPRYAGQDIPDTESLKTTLERVLPYWNSAIAPRLKAGEDVLIAAHGNSLRAIVKHLFDVPDDRIVGVEIPTGNPLDIELDAELKPVSARYLDEDRAQPLPALS